MPEDEDRRERARWSSRPNEPAPASAHDAADDDAPASAPLGQEFLFHLYRGSELLQQDHVDDAKVELEQALALQPRDTEGQGLLGIVYFRLGHYPRAIQIYEELVRTLPGQTTPKINLALCYLKTGQLTEARGLLEQVIQKTPEHKRAWGYLGLAFQRLGDIEKAAIALERADRPHLARRLREAQAAPDAIQELGPADPQGAVTEAPAPLHSIPVPGSRTGALPAPATRVILPPTLSRWARSEALVFPEHPPVVQHVDGTVLVRVDTAFNVRSGYVQVLAGAGAFRSAVLRRRARSGTPAVEGPLGGVAAPVVELRGDGRLVLGAPPGRRLQVFDLDTNALFLREERLVGFQATLTYENGRLRLGASDAPLVHLSGSGAVVIAVDGAVQTLELRAEQRAVAQQERIVGWLGTLLSSAPEQTAHGMPSGAVELSGDGTLLLDFG